MGMRVSPLVLLKQTVVLHHIFLPKFLTIQIPKWGVARYYQRVKESLVGAFNCVEKDNGRPTISNYSGSTWLKKNGQSTRCTHISSTTVTCVKIWMKKSVFNKPPSITFSSVDQLKERTKSQLKASITSLNKELVTHKDKAKESHKYYSSLR